MKNNISSTALRTVLVRELEYYAPFPGKNAWFKKEKEGAMKVTADTAIFAFDGEDMARTSWEEVRAQK
jgi:hypothetical protein